MSMVSAVEQYSATPKSAYQGAGAVSHYMSPGRRDPMKRLSEEPVTLGFLSTALDYLGPWKQLAF
ncbi:hypothetical protein GA0115234_106920 [Streptomyces sp. DvalAA-43]|nr:hypothetical protein GA0115234_106920 [Streptomyces sp. DvalAA-43]